MRNLRAMLQKPTTGKTREILTRINQDHPTDGLGCHMLEQAMGYREEDRLTPQMMEFLEMAAPDIHTVDDLMKEDFMPRKGPVTQGAQGWRREDLTFGNNSASISTTVLANWIEQAFRPTLVAAGVIKTIPVQLAGMSAFKIPKNSIPAVSSLPDNGAISYGDSDYTATTITPSWKYGASKITHELVRHSAVDLIADQLGLIGSAMAAQVDTDVISAMEAATPSNDSESNYVALGASTDISWAGLMAALADAEDSSQDVSMNFLVTNPTSYYQLMVDAQVKAMLPFATKGGVVGPKITKIGDLTILRSSNMSAKTSFLVDSTRLGYLLDAGPIETFDGRISGTVAYEVIALKAYGAGVVRTGAAYRIMDNTA